MFDLKSKFVQFNIHCMENKGVILFMINCQNCKKILIDVVYKKLLRQSQIVQNAMYSHMYDAVSYITPAVPFTLSQLGILTMRHILAVFMFDVCIFIYSPRVTYYSKAVLYVNF